MDLIAKNLAKLTCSLILSIFVASVATNGQTIELSPPQPVPLKLKIDVESLVWKMGDEAIVNVGFENITEKDVELHNQLFFGFTESHNERVEFGASISLSKT